MNTVTMLSGMFCRKYLFLSSFVFVVAACSGEPPPGSSEPAPPSAPAPTFAPTLAPSPPPTLAPTMEPTSVPTSVPTPIPTVVPTSMPTLAPTPVPTVAPTSTPTPEPTLVPTPVPTQTPMPPTLSTQEFTFDDQASIGSMLGLVEVDNPGNLILGFSLAPSGATKIPFRIDDKGQLFLESAILAGEEIEFSVEVSYGRARISETMRARIVTTGLASDQVPALGTKRAIWILADFNGKRGEHSTASVNAAMETLNKYVRTESYGQLDVIWTTTPFINMGTEITTELSGNVYTLRNFVTQKAREFNADYNSASYTYVYLGLPGGAFSGGGALGVRNGDVGTAWIGPKPWSPGIVHESFHMFGPGHAEVLMGDETYPAPNGSGGHDPYYFMGSESGAKTNDGNGYYTIHAGINVPMKYRMGWLKPANLRTVTKPGVYRILGHRSIKKPELNVVGLTIFADNKKFMVSYEPVTYSSQIKTNGLVVHWATGGVSRILDANPASVPDDPNIRQALNEVNELSDAAIELGKSMQVGNLYKVTFLGEGGEGENRWADVQIDF